MIRLLTLTVIAAGLLAGCSDRKVEPARIEGQVELAGRFNWEGVRVYVPGTSTIAFTNAEGRFVLEPLPEGRVEVVFQADDFQPVRKSLSLTWGQTYRFDQAIQLAALEDPMAGRRTARGTVRLEGGKVPTGTMVVFQGQGTSASAAVDATGEYAIAGLSPGNYQADFYRPGYVAVRRNVEIPAEGEVPHFDAVLTLGGTAAALSGRLIQGVAALEGTRDHSGILVSIEGTSKVAVTGPDGRFVLEDLPNETFFVAFYKSGYDPIRRGSGQLMKAPEDVRVTLGRKAEAPTTGTVEGFVQFEGGYQTDLSGVSIELRSQLAYQAKTQQNGLFRIQNVNPGVYILKAGIEGYEPFELLGIQVKAGDSVRVPPIVLQPSRQALGEQESLESQLAGMTRLSGKEDHAGIAVKIVGTSFTTSTDPSGAYLFSRVPSGAYELSFSYPGYKDETLQDIQIVAGQGLTLGPVTLYEEREKPYVLYTEPGDGAEGAPVRQFVDVLVVFSTRMKPETIKKSIRIVPEVAHDVYTVGEIPRAESDRAVIRLFRTRKPELQLAQEYQFRIEAGVRDVFDVAMEEPYEFSIRTSGPLIINTIPKDGEEGVFFTIGDYIVLDFNTEVDYKTLMRSLDISPRPVSGPMLFTERLEGGARAKLQVDFDDATDYTVRVGSSLRSAEGKAFDNTPYRFSFRTASIQDQPDANDPYFLPEGDQR